MAVAARKSAPLQPAEILDLIAAAKSKLPDLLRKQHEAAEASITSPEAEERYKACVADIAAAHATIERLQSAMVGATNRNKEAREAEQRAAAAAVRAHVGKLLDQRVAIVARIEGAIGEFVKGWHELIVLSDKALVAYPNGPPPGGLALSNMELVALVSAELYRQGGTVPVTGRPQLERLPPTIPGPKCPDYMLLNQPEKITKLSVAIEQANNLARSIMEGKRNVAAA
jgi:hypothetical protein